MGVVFFQSANDFFSQSLFAVSQFFFFPNELSILVFKLVYDNFSQSVQTDDLVAGYSLIAEFRSHRLKQTGVQSATERGAESPPSHSVAVCPGARAHYWSAQPFCLSVHPSAHQSAGAPGAGGARATMWAIITLPETTLPTPGLWHCSSKMA